MSLDGFLTFITLVIAIYAFIPPAGRLRFQLSSFLQTSIALIFFIAVLYFEFFEQFKLPCPSFFGTACSWFEISNNSLFSPNQIAFFLVIFWSLISFWIYTSFRPSVGSLPKILQILEELLNQKQITNFLDFVGPHIGKITNVAHRRLFSQRAHDRLVKLHSKTNDEFENWISGVHDIKPIMPNFFQKILIQTKNATSYLSLLFPSNVKAENAARDIIRMTYRSNEIVGYIAKYKPLTGIELMKNDVYDRHDFSSNFLINLINDNKSIVYEELKNNQNTDKIGFHVPESNRILYFLFSDAKIAEKLGVWKPLGDNLLKLLRQQENPDFAEYLNRSADYFEDERWDNPAYPTIFFFEIMVTKAAEQDIPWHMWLSYYALFLEELLKCQNSSKATGAYEPEFPNRSCRLIYEIFHNLGSWVQLVNKLPEDSIHSKVPDSFSLNNGNIPVSSAICLGICIKNVLLSDRISKKFSTYMLEVIMTDIKSLRKDGVDGKMRSYLIQSIIKGGDGYNSEYKYIEKICDYMKEIDPVLKHDVADFCDAVNAALK